MFAKSLSVCPVFTFITTLIVQLNAARILAVYPTPALSHQVTFRPLTQELARRGHEVVVLTTDPAFPEGTSPYGITEINLHNISYDLWNERFVKQIQGNSDDSMKNTQIAYEVLIDIFEVQINAREVQDLIKRRPHFDLILLEACVRSTIVMSHIFEAPAVLISSLGANPGNLQLMGGPSHPVYYPEFTRKRIYNLTSWEKVTGAFEDFQVRYMQHCLVETENEMIRRNFGPNIPSIAKLANNVHMLLINVHSAWDGNRPVPPGVIYLGGLHQKPQKKLPQDLKSYLDASKHGVIYMSFGTNVRPSKLPAEKIQVFTKVFSSLPYDVLWKWDTDELPERPNNTRISKWFPQSDLLRHPKVKLFITQGGLQSTDEALIAGVPLIAFPMLIDQWYNAEKYVYFGIGMKFEISSITEDVLREAINRVMFNESYHSNVKRLGTLMHDRPQSSLQRAVWWTEYMIRHGAAEHLRSGAFNISWTEYLMLDIVVTVAVTAASILFIFCYSISKCRIAVRKVKGD